MYSALEFGYKLPMRCWYAAMPVSTANELGKFTSNATWTSGACFNGLLPAFDFAVAFIFAILLASATPLSELFHFS